MTAATVRAAVKPGKYHDTGGLFLRVEASGSRRWVQRLTVNGRRCEVGLGSAEVVTLAEARAAALDNRKTVQAGGDPLQARREARGIITFAEAVESYLAVKVQELDNAKHRAQWRATLETYALPVLGRLRVDSITVQDVLRVLSQPIEGGTLWTERTETASRLRGRIENVLAWATVSGHRQGDNPARWAGNLKELLPAPAKVAKGGNQPALALSDVAAWWQALARRDGMATAALRFLTMTVARSGEVRGATWAELDLQAGVWTIPAGRMKMRREHRVPLPAEAVALLEGLPRTGELVFPSKSGKPLSDMSLSAVMRRMQEAEEKAGRAGWLDPQSKRPAVPHGLRSSFRQWAAEQGLPRDMAEMALAHWTGDATERAYQRADMLERRRAMMAAWAAYLTETRSNVVALYGKQQLK